MEEVLFALLMFLNGTMIEHTPKDNLSSCLKSKRIAMKENSVARLHLAINHRQFLHRFGGTLLFGKRLAFILPMINAPQLV